MTWYRVKNWKFKNYNGKLGISIVDSEKIDESEIPNIVHETLSTSVIDDTIDDYYGDVEICGNKYPASEALKSTDGIVYDEMRYDICEMKIEEIIDGLPDKPKYFQAMIEQCKIYWEGGGKMILSLVAVVVMTYATVAIMAGFGYKRKGEGVYSYAIYVDSVLTLCGTCYDIVDAIRQLPKCPNVRLYIDGRLYLQN